MILCRMYTRDTLFSKCTIYIHHDNPKETGPAKGVKKQKKRMITLYTDVLLA